jgi:hypothetical protein
LLRKLHNGRRNLQQKDVWLIPQLNLLTMFENALKIKVLDVKLE